MCFTKQIQLPRSSSGGLSEMSGSKRNISTDMASTTSTETDSLDRNRESKYFNLTLSSPVSHKRRAECMTLHNVVSLESVNECNKKRLKTCVDNKKSVRFATNSSTGEINALVVEFSRVPSELRNEVWWSSKEFDERYEEDMATMASVEDCYRNALRLAYDSVKQASCFKVDLSFQAVSVCADARGMEAQVLPEIADYVKGHCEAVLGVQKMARTANKDFSWNESTAKVFRLLSIKYSRRSQLVAAKMGKYDQQQVVLH